MEHFPSFSKTQDPYQPLEIPWLGGSWKVSDDVACSDLHLDDFESRRGKGNTSTEDEKNFVRDLQARLCFGMLYGVLQLDEFDEFEFIANSSDGMSKIFTTCKLRDYLKRWKSDHDVLANQCHSIKHEDDATMTESNFANPQELLDARREKAEKCLNSAYNSWCYLEAETLGGQDKEKKVEYLQIELSIQVLGTALEHAIESVSSYCKFCPFEQWVGTFGVPWRRNKSNTYLFDRMAGQGWCPTVIEGLRKQGGLSSMYYTSLLAPPSRKDRDHVNCKPTDKACSWTNIRTFKYKPLHVKDDCTCGMLEPEGGMGHISDIVRKDGIPLLYYEDGKLSVEAQRRGTAYTAISHVWADGLGNLEENALPKCQFDQVKKYISELSLWSAALDTDDEVYDDDVWKAKEPVGDRPSLSLEVMSRRYYFWIDTICIPTDDSKLRDKAIAQMRAVYKRANRVLVLDADLMNTTVTPLSKSSQLELRPDIHLKISASNWQKRYWTLQEAVLARKLFFQFANGAFEKRTWGDYIEQQAGTEQLEKHFAKHGDWRPNFIEHCFDNEVTYYAEEASFDWFLENKLRDKVARLASEKDHHGSISLNPEQAPRAKTVWNALALRACSFEADKARCMGILLDMDISVFTIPDEIEVQAQMQASKLTSPADKKGYTMIVDQVRASYRTEKFWEEMSAVPAGLLCFPAAKHKQKHLKWAPLDLDVLSMTANPVNLPAFISPEGIRLRLHGIKLSRPLNHNPQSIIPIKLGSKVYYIRNNTRYNNEKWVEPDDSGEPKRNIDFLNPSDQQLAIILGQEPLPPGTSNIPEFVAALGALVSIKRQASELLVVRYIGAISIFLEDSIFNTKPTVPWTPEELLERRYVDGDDNDEEAYDGTGGRGGGRGGGRRGSGVGAGANEGGESGSGHGKDEKNKESGGSGGKKKEDIIHKIIHATWTDVDQAWFIEF